MAISLVAPLEQRDARAEAVPAAPQAPASPDQVAPDSHDAIVLTLPGSMAAGERDALVRALADQGATVVVAQEGDPAATPELMTPDPLLAADVERGMADFQAKLGQLLERFDELPNLLSRWLDRLSEGPDASGMAVVALGLALMLAVGSAGEWVYARATGAWRRSYESASPERFSARLGYALSHLLRQLLGLAVFVILAVLVSRLMFPPLGPAQKTAMVVIWSIAYARMGMIFAAFLVAPGHSGLRLVPAGDGDARLIFSWLVAIPIVRGVALGSVTLAASGEPEPSLLVLYQVCISSVVKAVEIAVMIRIARPVGDMIRKGVAAGQPVGRVRELIARTWHIFLIVISLGIFAVAVYAGVRGSGLNLVAAASGTRMVVVLLPLIALALGALIQELFAADRAGDQEAAARWRGYGRIARSVTYGVLTLVGIVVVARLWGADLFEATRSTAGARIAGALIEIAATVLIAYVLWEIARIAIDPYVDEGGAGTSVEAGEVGGSGVSRIATMLPVLRLFLQIALVVISVMVVLSALGVNIGPLLAGAGVVGLAVGFGAQTLVRDIISGMFFLMDDAFRKGEYIDVGSVMGTVERISLRSLRLRHHNGPVHTIPFGEISSVTNYSRDWAIIKFDLRLPFEVDIEKVRKIIKKVGLAMMEDDELGRLMLEPLKSQGVKQMDDSALIIGCKLMAKPGQQFYVRREAFARIQRAFAQQGIQFAPRRVIVESSSPAQAAAGAAAATVETEAAS